jgi:putative membrane protein
MNNYGIERNESLAKKLNVYAYIISALVIVLVGIMRRTKIDLGIDFTFLPPVHALLNSLVAFFLILALFFIKRKNVDAHRKSIYAAMICSALFLLCYVLYHFTTQETKFCMEGTKKTIYFILLISHIVLAGLSLPFILLTFIKGFTGLINEHRKMAKWVYPVWLYVAITGPLCYFMLYPCYQ